MLAALQGPLSQYPSAFAYWLGTLEFVLAPPKEIAVIGRPDGDDTQEMLRALFQPYRPNQVVAMTDEQHTAGHPELVESRPAQNGQATAYVCRRFVCQQPVTEPAVAGSEPSTGRV